LIFFQLLCYLSALFQTAKCRAKQYGLISMSNPIFGYQKLLAENANVRLLVTFVLCTTSKWNANWNFYYAQNVEIFTCTSIMKWGKCAARWSIVQSVIVEPPIIGDAVVVMERERLLGNIVIDVSICMKNHVNYVNLHFENRFSS
jgi:hypothetical protein